MRSYATLSGTARNTKKAIGGFCLVLAVSGLSLLSNTPAEAKLLNGGVEVIDIESAPNDTTGGVAPEVGSNTKTAITGGARPSYDNAVAPAQPAAQQRSASPSAALQPGQPVLAYGRSPNVAQLTPPPNSFPVNYSGRWQCVTRVVDSAVQTIAAGTEVVSEVCFAEVSDGRVIARWLQPGWTETQASAMSWNAREAQTDRTSYYFGEGMNGAWASRSRDHFLQVSTDRLECKSYVDQYIDGQYLGRYRTISILTRIGTVNTIAQGARENK